MGNTKSWRRPLGLLLGPALLTAGILGLTAGPAGAAGHQATTVKVLRPVTTAGHAAHGWRVVTDNRDPISCFEASYVAVESGIDFCGSSADYTPACWASSTAHHVLCIDPFRHKTLRSIRLSGTFTRYAGKARPQPLTLAMRSGLTFQARDGGAADMLKEHPTWVAWYYQQGGRRSIYGPRNTDTGINRSSAAWFVKVYDDTDQPGYYSYVGAASYVGTAH